MWNFIYLALESSINRGKKLNLFYFSLVPWITKDKILKFILYLLLESSVTGRK